MCMRVSGCWKEFVEGGGELVLWRKLGSEGGLGIGAESGGQYYITDVILIMTTLNFDFVSSYDTIIKWTITNKRPCLSLSLSLSRSLINRKKLFNDRNWIGSVFFSKFKKRNQCFSKLLLTFHANHDDDVDFNVEERYEFLATSGRDWK